MKLKYCVDSLDNVPEEYHSLYTERDGKYYLEIEGGPGSEDVGKLTTALSKERADHKATKAKLRAYGETTPEQVDELREQTETLQAELDVAKKGTGNNGPELEALVEKRVGAKLKGIQRELDQKKSELEEANTERTTLRKERDRNTVLDSARGAAKDKSVGVKLEDVGEDFDLWAEHNFSVNEDGKVVNKDGLGPRDVLLDFQTQGQRRHWFGETKGGGASGGKGRESFANNPFAQETQNITEIGRVSVADPKRAIRMAKAASKKGYDATEYLPDDLRAEANK